MPTSAASASPRWVLALESSTANGGVALIREGEEARALHLAEGLRHGRELMPAAAAILAQAGLKVGDLWGIAVSAGPGSYTGVRVGVMSAKAMAYGSGCRLTAVSSLAALAFSLGLNGSAANGDIIMAVRNARRDEVYAGVYRLENGEILPLASDAALAPEEARTRLIALMENHPEKTIRLAGSGFAAYPEAFGDVGGDGAFPETASPTAVGLLGWRQFLREEFADPLQLQPEYPRRDPNADWTRDKLIGMA